MVTDACLLPLLYGQWLQGIVLLSNPRYRNFGINECELISDLLIMYQNLKFSRQ